MAAWPRSSDSRPIEHADAGGTVHLVRGERVEVAVERLQVHALMRHGLGAVDQHHRAARVRERVISRTGSTVPSALETCAQATMRVRSSDACGEAVSVDDAAAIHRHHLHDGAGLLAQTICQGTMLAWCSSRGEQDLVAGVSRRGRA